MLDFKEGTLYPALHKLENEGMVESSTALKWPSAAPLPDHESGRGTLTRTVPSGERFESGDDDSGGSIAMIAIGHLVGASH